MRVILEHFHEDVFEDYAFDRLSEVETARFEEHLLICEECQNSLAEADEAIRLLKSATAAYIADHPTLPAIRETLGPTYRWGAVAAAILLITGLTAVSTWRSPQGETRTVALEAYRGEGIVAPAGHPLDLQIDLKDVRAAASYRVEVVDATGRRVWAGGTPARLANGLRPGAYWMRLSTDTGELLREYGVTVR